MADNLGEENEENVICKKSLTVYVHEIGRVTFDLTGQETNPTPKAGKRDEMADNLCEENEENVICQKSLTVHVNEFFSVKVKTWLFKQAFLS